jgi:hypothetical protein
MFSISISNARVNWIDVDVSVGDVRRQFMASAVLNDPLRELADLGVFVATREAGTLGVRFWLEPAGLELRAYRRPELVLALYEADDASPALLRPRLVVEEEIDAAAAARAILGCLLRVEQILSPQTWQYAFPAERTSVLAHAIATSR